MRKRNKGESSTAAYRIIQVPMDIALLEQVDAAAGRVAESRAAYIRGACRQRLTSEEAAALDRRYVEGYRRTPEQEAWGRLGAQLLARRLLGDRWSLTR
ncbi:MAG: hypothetical protein HYV94_12905 [Candidatus Rokubacteria bacterium]|nr:hypothetical protein [Candidatus Rokubacteria bacterium]